MNKKAAVELVILGLIAVITLAGMMLLFSGASGNAAAPSCTDTDGLNFTVKGVVYYDRQYTDTCINAHGTEAPSGYALWEYYCKDNKMKKLHHWCKDLCIDGVCVER
jgi:hypothetical protein